MPSRARALIQSTLRGTPWLARALELLDQAASGDSDECVALWSEHGGAMHALALVGLVAGADGAGRLHLLLGDDSHLCARACNALRAMGARFVLAEWPDDDVFASAERQLREAGFMEEARIPDFYGPGVAQVFIRRDL